MRSLDQKVEEIVGKIVNNNLEDYDDLVEIVWIALIEQDRDTRHACAEAILDAVVPGDDSIDVTVACGKVMNCNGGLYSNGNQHEKKAQRIVKMIKELE